MDLELSEQILTRRLRAQCLTGASCGTPEAAVGRLVGVQAQDYGQATWSVGARTAGATEADVEEAFAAGRILRTHVLRPTWHIVLSADIRWLLTATAPRITARNRRRYEELGLDVAARDRAAAAFVAALRGGRPLTRTDMAEVAADAGVSPEGQRLPYLLMSAELAAVICSGPRRGKRQTWVLLEERASGVPDLPRDAALVELAVRFFAGHGPATQKDLAWWAGLTLTEVRAAIERAGDQLRREEAGGLVLWSSAAEPTDGPSPDSDAPVVRLIQGYDEYIMGYADTRWLLARPGSTWAVATPPVGRLVVVLDGRVAGFWRRDFRKDRVVISVELLDAWDAADRAALAAEAARFGAFMDRAVELVVI
jgi:hypothetical protein